MLPIGPFTATTEPLVRWASVTVVTFFPPLLTAKPSEPAAGRTAGFVTVTQYAFMIGTMIVEMAPWWEGWPAISAGGAKDGVRESKGSKLAFVSDEAAEALCGEDGTKLEEILPEASSVTATSTAAKTRCRRMDRSMSPPIGLAWTHPADVGV